MNKSEVFITLIQACSFKNTKLNSISFSMFNQYCIKDPEAYFKKKGLEEEWNTLSIKEKEIFTNEELFFNLLVEYKFKTKENNINLYPNCEVCNKPVKFLGLTNGYKVTCSKECRSIKTKNTYKERTGYESPRQNPEVIIKAKNTYKERTGYECALQNPEVKQQIKKNNLQKYGVENFIQTQSFKEKSKQTCLEKYGTEFASSSVFVKEKMRKTCLEKYGTEHHFSSPEIKNKIKNTCLKHYGVENPLKSEEIRTKIKETCLEKYGTEFVSSSIFVKEKMRKTCLEKYGVDNPARKDFKNLDKIKDTNFLIKNFTEKEYILIDKIKDFFNFKSSILIKEITKKLEKEGYKIQKMYKLQNDFINELEIKLNKKLEKQFYPIKDRNFRVDAYDPETNTIYEFLGDFWHGNPEVYDLNDFNRSNKTKFQDLYGQTFDRLNFIKSLGYNVKYIWENDFLKSGLNKIKLL